MRTPDKYQSLVIEWVEYISNNGSNMSFAELVLSPMILAVQLTAMSIPPTVPPIFKYQEGGVACIHKDNCK